MRKIFLIMSLVLSFFLLSSCSQNTFKVKDAAKSQVFDTKPKNQIISEVSDNGDNHRAVVNVEKLSKPKSFLKEAKYDIPGDKVYYTGKTVVLTYHHISNKPVSGITIKPERFEGDLKMLREGNFNVISFRDMVKTIEGEEQLPPNAVVITFDDGYDSFYKYAFPLLKKYNMPAVNFIVTSWAERYVPSDADINYFGYDMTREMYKSGLVDIQSHTHHSHEYVVRNEKGQKGGMLAYKIYDSKSGTYESDESYSKRVIEDLTMSIPIIERYTDNKPDTLCFPFGHYNSKLVQLGKQSGFKYFVTTAYGYNKEGTKNPVIRRIRSGYARLNPQKLKEDIINCGQGKTPKK